MGNSGSQVTSISPDLFVRKNPRPFEEVYRVSRPLGEGAYAEVFLCTHLMTKVQRAAKVFRKDTIHPRESQKLIETEISILKELSHPGIVRMHEYFEDTAELCIVMELSSGGELLGELVDNALLSEPQIARIAAQLLECLAYIHSCGIAHRDIKPDNLMFEDRSEASHIKLIDFGCACRVSSGVTMHEFAGCRDYMAPEVYEKEYTLLCDLWSAGVIVYYLFARSLPFRAQNKAQLAKVVTSLNYSLEGPQWDRVSEEAKDFIRNLLCRESERLSAAEALAHPWISHWSSCDEASSPVLRRTFDQLASPRSDNVLVNAVRCYVVSQLVTHEDIEEASAAFRTIDTDGNGYLSREELVTAYRRVYKDRNEAAVNHILQAVGQSDRIDYTTYLLATVDCSALLTDDRLQAIFTCFDTDQNGLLTRSDLLKALGVSRSKQWKQATAELPATLDYTDFKALLRDSLHTT